MIKISTNKNIKKK